MIMLYTKGDKYTTDGVNYDTIIVDEEEIGKKLKEGYFRCYTEMDKPKTKAKKDELD